MAAQRNSDKTADHISFDVERALERGLDNLHDLAEWMLRDQPRAVARLRRQYKTYANFICGILERAARR